MAGDGSNLTNDAGMRNFSATEILPEWDEQLGGPMPAAHEYDQRVLLCVIGKSPAVVTETLYALITRSPAFVPTEIRVVTTRPGAELAGKTLLDEPRVRQLLEDRDIDPNVVRFDRACIHVPRGPHGAPLEDLRTEAENAAMADGILRLAADAATNDSCAIHASLAGGRKTMGFYLGQIMSLVGRSQDNPSHVLINPEFESAPDFYYPPRRPIDVECKYWDPHTRQQTVRTVNTSAARIDLAFVPFIRVNSTLPKDWAKLLRDNATAYTQAVEAAQIGVEEPLLVVDLPARTARVGRTTAIDIKLSDAALGFYALAAARRKIADEPVATAINPTRLPLNALLMVREYAELDHVSEDGTDELEKLLRDRDKDRRRYYNARANEIKAALEQQVGFEAPEIYGLQKYRKQAFGLFGLQPDNIEIHWPTGNELDLEDLPWD